MLVLVGRRGGGGSEKATTQEVMVEAKSLHHWKRAYAARFQGWRWWRCWCKVSTVENEHTLLVFDGRGGGGP